MADAVGGQHLAHEGPDLRALERGDERLHDAHKVGAGDHRVDALERQRPAGVDCGDAGVRVRAPDERRVQHAGKVDVVDEAAASREQPRVLDAQEAAPDVTRLLVLRGHAEPSAAARTAATTPT
jgi:hypothetical protein